MSIHSHFENDDDFDFDQVDEKDQTNCVDDNVSVENINEEKNLNLEIYHEDIEKNKYIENQENKGDIKDINELEDNISKEISHLTYKVKEEECEKNCIEDNLTLNKNNYEGVVDNIKTNNNIIIHYIEDNTQCHNEKEDNKEVNENVVNLAKREDDQTSCVNNNEKNEHINNNYQISNKTINNEADFEFDVDAELKKKDDEKKIEKNNKDEYNKEKAVDESNNEEYSQNNKSSNIIVDCIEDNVNSVVENVNLNTRIDIDVSNDDFEFDDNKESSEKPCQVHNDQNPNPEHNDQSHINEFHNKSDIKDNRIITNKTDDEDDFDFEEVNENIKHTIANIEEKPEVEQDEFEEIDESLNKPNQIINKNQVEIAEKLNEIKSKLEETRKYREFNYKPNRTIYDDKSYMSYIKKKEDTTIENNIKNVFSITLIEEKLKKDKKNKDNEEKIKINNYSFQDLKYLIPYNQYNNHVKNIYSNDYLSLISNLSIKTFYNFYMDNREKVIPQKFFHLIMRIYDSNENKHKDEYILTKDNNNNNLNSIQKNKTLSLSLKNNDSIIEKNEEKDKNINEKNDNFQELEDNFDDNKDKKANKFIIDNDFFSAFEKSSFNVNPQKTEAVKNESEEKEENKIKNEEKSFNKEDIYDIFKSIGVIKEKKEEESVSKMNIIDEMKELILHLPDISYMNNMNFEYPDSFWS